MVCGPSRGWTVSRSSLPGSLQRYKITSTTKLKCVAISDSMWTDQYGFYHDFAQNDDNKPTLELNKHGKDVSSWIHCSSLFGEVQSPWLKTVTLKAQISQNTDDSVTKMHTLKLGFNTNVVNASLCMCIVNSRICRLCKVMTDNVL